MSEFVYVCWREDGLRKLGWTLDPDTRRRHLINATGVHHEIERTWEVEQWARDIELAAHRALHAFKSRAFSSIEVYSLPLEQIELAVESALVDQDVEVIADVRCPEPPPEVVLYMASRLGVVDGAKVLHMTGEGFRRAVAKASAEFEAAIGKERTMAGLARARAEGRRGGRAQMHPDEVLIETAAKHGIGPGARHLGMSKAGFIKALARVKERQNAQ